MTNRARDYFAVLKIFEEVWESGERKPTLTVLSSPKQSMDSRFLRNWSDLGVKVIQSHSFHPGFENDSCIMLHKLIF